MKTIDKLMHGAIDMHLHHDPDASTERRVDALEVARQAVEAGMRAVVLKSHEYPTAPVAYTVSRVVPNIAVFGAISLDFPNGGLNPAAVEISAQLGAKIVWLPTSDAIVDRKRHGLEGGISVLDAAGKIVPPMEEILDIVKKHDIVLATGHVSGAEIFAVVDAARRKGINKIVITHASHPVVGAKLSIQEQKELADRGAIIEHCFICTMPMNARLDPAKIAETIRAIGAERTIMSTDLGQDWNPPPAEGLRMFVASMLKLGITEAEIELMIKTNPARLLGLS